MEVGAIEEQGARVVDTDSRRRPIEAARATIVRLGNIPGPGVNKVVREFTPVSRHSSAGD